MKLERFESNGLELLIDKNTGEVFASQNAVVRMCEAPESTIRGFASSQLLGSLRVEIPTEQGIRMARLYTEEEIYLCLQKYNSKLLVQCAKAGLRVYLHQLAGFKVSSNLNQVNTDDEFKTQVLGMFQSLTTQITEMRTEMQEQNQKIALMLPDHETMNNIREAMNKMEYLESILEGIAESLKTNPNQTKHTLNYFVQGMSLTRGQLIKAGKYVTDWLTVNSSQAVGKKYNSRTSPNVYPECARPLIEHTIKNLI